MPVSRLPASPTLILRRRLHGDVIPTATIHLLLHVGSVLEVLVESADVAGDLVPGLEGVGDQWDCRRLFVSLVFNFAPKKPQRECE